MNNFIPSLLEKLNTYYDPNSTTGNKYTGSNSGITEIKSIYSGISFSETNTIELKDGENSKTILSDLAEVITVSSSNLPNSFAYEIVEGKIVIIGNNLKITVNEELSENIEVVGISNVIEGRASSDKFTVIGYDNKVDADKGNDEITIFGGDNKTTFSDDSSDSVIFNDKKYEINLYDIQNKSSEITFSVNDEEDVLIDATNAKIILQDDTSDNIILSGNENYLDTSVGNDKIIINGNNNFIVPGAGDDSSDSIINNGTGNKILGDEKDIVSYNAPTGEIVITNTDDSSHYVEIVDSSNVVHKYLIKRNISSTDDVKIRYEINDKNEIIFTGNDAQIISVSDNEDIIKVIGNNNHIDTSVGSDKIIVEGEGNSIHSGEDDDEISVIGKGNEVYGDDGYDIVNISDKNNTIDSSGEEINNIFILNSANQAQTYETKDGRKYFLTIAESVKEKNIDVTVIARELNDGTLYFEADNLIITADDGQVDNIFLKGNNSKIFAGDKDDNIVVEGDNNFVDGWSGNDTIKTTGINNKVYGFLGDDNISIIQRELTETELKNALKSVPDVDSDGNTLTNEKRIEIANSNNANYVDGEFDTDTVEADVYTKISSNTEVYKSLAQSVRLEPTENEKKIFVTDNDGNVLSYTLKNHVTRDNPFVSTRTVRYEMSEGKLIVYGDYISVVADEGQDDNVKIIGNNSFLDLYDGLDTLEAVGNFNLLFAGIGKDSLNVKGNNNEVYGDTILNAVDYDDSDKILVEGKNNKVVGGNGNDIITLYGECFKAFGNAGDDIFNVTAVKSEIHGGDSGSPSGEDTITINDSSSNKVYGFSNYIMEENVNKIVLSPENRTDKIEYTDVDGTKITFKIEPNISAPEALAGEIIVDYEIIDVTINGENKKQLVITGSNIMLSLTDNSDKSISVKFAGNDSRIETFGGTDNIEVIGDRNKILSGGGQNLIDINGDSNTISSGNKDDKINVNGDNNDIINNAETEDINIVGSNNIIRHSVDEERTAGSLLLTEKTSTQIIVHKNRAYEISIYGIEEENLKNTEINVQYEFDSEGYMIFEADNIKVRIIDDEKSVDEDENVIKNKDSIKLIGNNCWITGSYGDDVIVVEGDNNNIDGWKGDDSMHVIGKNNIVRGFYGDDVFIIEGDNNLVDGEHNDDELTIISGDDNKYLNVEKINQK